MVQVLDTFCVGPYCAVDPSETSAQSIVASSRKGSKKKGSFSDSLAVVRSSGKIRNLAVLVIGYGLSHRLFEFAWKGAVRALHASPQAYQSVLADVSIFTGWATITFMLLGRFVFQHLGWGAAAAATPLAMMLSGGVFFGLSLASGAGISVMGMGPENMAAAGVIAGMVTQVAARASKYSLFDPAKEMVYIGTSQEERSKGKAAVDLLGSQFGKTGGAWVTNVFLLASGSLTASMPAVMLSFMAVMVAWLQAVKRLENQLKKSEESSGQSEQKSTSHDVAQNGFSATTTSSSEDLFVQDEPVTVTASHEKDRT